MAQVAGALTSHGHPNAGGWKELTREDLEAVRKHKKAITIDGVRISLDPVLPKAFGPPAEYSAPRTTLWTFPDRGSWATHKGDFRGNWSPYIPRTLMLKYTKPGDTVLDPMCGAGTTLVEGRLLGRHAVGIDINEDAVFLTRSRLDFAVPQGELPLGEGNTRTFVGDARNLEFIEEASVDLVATHPPYANIIRYTRDQVDGDLSSMPFPVFLEAMEQVATQAFRTLKPGKHCAILAGDTRKRRHHVPVSLGILNSFLHAGFVLKEDVIKAQHNMKATRETWGGSYDFYLLAHEHLFVFRKPSSGEKGTDFPWSSKWW